jgi:hypothetical protein
MQEGFDKPPCSARPRILWNEPVINAWMLKDVDSVVVDMSDARNTKAAS